MNDEATRRRTFLKFLQVLYQPRELRQRRLLPRSLRLALSSPSHSLGAELNEADLKILRAARLAFAVDESNQSKESPGEAENAEKPEKVAGEGEDARKDLPSWCYPTEGRLFVDLPAESKAALLGMLCVSLSFNLCIAPV